MASYLLSFLAGVLSTLSPCVLPVLPLVVGRAAGAHRLGPLAMAGGLVVSSTLVGFTLASLGPWLGIDAGVVRVGAAILLIVAGVLVLVPRAQQVAAALLAPVAARAGGMKVGKPSQGLLGQLLLGAVLGAAWSPCAGPTLAAAIGLAAQTGERLGAFVMMLCFGIGAATPLLVVGVLLRKGLGRFRGTLAKVARTLKPAMGILLVGVGLTVASGTDTAIEARLLSLLPQSWIDLVARI